MTRPEQRLPVDAEGFVLIPYDGSADRHLQGDPEKCGCCCCGVPEGPCETEGCDGKGHQVDLDEMWNEEDAWWVLTYRCDKCGEPLYD